MYTKWEKGNHLTEEKVILQEMEKYQAALLKKVKKKKKMEIPAKLK